MFSRGSILRVGICLRRDAKTNPGGDVIQALKSVELLRDLGVDANLITGDISGNYDVLHLFNLTRVADTYRYSLYAKQRKIPYVLTPIWHSLEQMGQFYKSLYAYPFRFPITQYLAVKELYYERRSLNLSVIKIVFFWKSVMKEIVLGAAKVVVNSPEEGETLKVDLNLERVEYQVVPNGVDLSLQCSEQYPENLIVCSGRIEPRKNTLLVVRAFLASRKLKGYKLLLLGEKNLKHKDYCRDVDRLVDGKAVNWSGSVDFQQAQQIYSKAKVLVLASFFETTGLVGIEALYQNTNVVMTTCCYTDFYYGNTVQYCDPYSETSIRLAMEQSASAGAADIKAGYFDFFSWQSISRKFLKIYKEVV